VRVEPPLARRSNDWEEDFDRRMVGSEYSAYNARRQDRLANEK